MIVFLCSEEVDFSAEAEPEPAKPAEPAEPTAPAEPEPANHPVATRRKVRFVRLVLFRFCGLLRASTPC